MQLILMIVISYLMGSIPTSIIAGKLLKNLDIRTVGSGNAGATNAFRILGPTAGTIVLLIDMAKGFIPVVWISQLGIADGPAWEPIIYQLIAGLSAMFGHIWTIFAGFKGGKGVGTAAGMLLGLTPLTIGICLLVFIVTVAITRYVSLGSILAALTFLIVTLVRKYALGVAIPDALLIISIFIPALIIYTHRANIQRLLKGEENKMKFGKSTS